MECIYCKYPIPDNGKLCQACGFPYPDACIACGAQLPHKARYCTDCGSKRGVAIIKDDWITVPAGNFMMGTIEEGFQPPHRIDIEAFNILSTPVTFEMYDTFCNATNHEKADDYGWGRCDRPVIGVSYWDAVDYCSWLGKIAGWKVRLPTEAEWEYACRAGTATPCWTGDTITSREANIANCMTTPVRNYSPNNWGIYDMIGNVWEWCASEFEIYYNGKERMNAAQDRSNDNKRANRGSDYSTCGWFDSGGADFEPDGVAEKAQSGKCRMGEHPDSTGSMIGFRIVRDV